MASSKISGKNMKINERSLASFALSREGIDKEGFLNKKGEVNRGYQRRWFVLKGNLLFYYEKAGDRQPIGVIILEKCNIEVSDGDRFAFSISFESASNTRTYILCADNEKEMERWMKCITAASYNYTQMVVKEFEKTLLRIRANELEMTRQAVGDDLVVDPAIVQKVPLECIAKPVPNASNNFDNTDRGRASPKPRRATTKAEKPKKANLLQRSVTASGKSQTLNAKHQNMDLTTLSNIAAASQKLKGFTRSKSSENIQKIAHDRSPNISRRKTKVKSSTNYTSASPVPPDSENFSPLIAYELEKTTFEILHTSFGAAIWTKVREYEQQHGIGDKASELIGAF